MVLSTNLQCVVIEELVLRHFQIIWRWALPHAAGRVIVAAVTRAEPAVIVACVRERDAAQMRADAHDDQPLHGSQGLQRSSPVLMNAVL